MKNKVCIPRHRINNRWLRLCSALAMAFILLLIPVTLGTVIRIPLPNLSQPASTPAEIVDQSSVPAIEMTLPFGPALVRAAGGLTVTKVAASTVDLGGVLTYTLTVTNGTGGTLTFGDNVGVFENLPSGAVDCLPAASPSGWSGGCTPGVDPTVWVLFPGSFPNNTALVFTYTVEISSSLSNQAEIVNDNYGGFIGSNFYFGSPVTTTVDAPVWAITKTVSSDTIQPGQTLVYTITATNIGAFATSGAYTITDAVPDNTTLVNVSLPGNISTSPPTWAFNDSLAPSGVGTRVVTYSVQVTSPLTNGVKIVNDGYAVSGGGIASGATNDSITTTVNSAVTLSITKTASSDPIEVGETLTYTLTVTNNATTGPAQNVVITDSLSSFVSYLSAGFVGGATGTITDTGGNPIIWTLTNPIPPSGSVQVTVTVQVSSTLPNPAKITNNFQASASNAPQEADSMDVVVEPGGVDSVILALNPTTLNNLCETTVATATVLDAFSNPISGASVSIAEFPSNIHVAPLTLSSGTTNGSGVFTATFQGIAADPNVSMVASSGVEFDGDNLTIVTGTPLPESLDLSVSPNPLAPGGATAVVQGIVRDCNNDLVSGQDVNFTLSDIGLASFPGPSDTITTTTVTGVATATLTSASSAGTLTITGTTGTVQEVIALFIESPVLTITKTANPNSGGTVQPGSTIIYDLILSNTGTAAATGIVITDELHSGVGFVTGSLIGATGNVFNNSGVITFSVTSSLGIGLAMTARIEVTVTAALSGTIITNTAEASDQTGPTGSSDMVSHQVITTTSTNNDVYLPLVVKE